MKCEYQQLGLLDHIEDEEKYHRLLRKYNMEALAKPKFDKYPEHRKLVASLLRFYEETTDKQRRSKSTAPAKLAEQGEEEKHRARQRRQVYDSLKNLLTQLSFSPEGPLVAVQLERITQWYKDKMDDLSSSAALRDQLEI